MVGTLLLKYEKHEILGPVSRIKKRKTEISVEVLRRYPGFSYGNVGRIHKERRKFVMKRYKYRFPNCKSYQIMIC